MSEPAILFTYYQSPNTCLERLQRLRRLNPGVPIYGLYSGSAEEEAKFANFQDGLDHNYSFTTATFEWLRRDYDKLICEWFQEAGSKLAWTHLFVHAWDLLLLEPISLFCPSDLEPDELILPGLRPLEKMDENVVDPKLPPTEPGNWSWLKVEPKEFRRFATYARAVYPEVQFYCEVSPFAVLSRPFCETYNRVARPIPGFIEYRFPTMVEVLGFRFRELNLPSWFWEFYNAEKEAITPEVVHEHQGKSRLFHPVYEPVHL